MRSNRVVPAFIAGVLAAFPTVAVAQDPPTPAPPTDQLPPVEVIQKQPTPAPAAKKKSAAKKKQPASPAPQPPAAVATPDPTTQNPNSVYGAAGSTGAAQRAYDGATPPVNPTQLVPSNLQNFSSAATIVTPEDLTERQPRNVNEALTRVPGVIVVNDDGNAMHGGIGLRGSPPRRTRKVLYMEDGHPLNLALWLDPSVHYATPLDRVESVEVLKGTVITHGPNNNFGVINLRALSPFGPDETVISSAIGWTELRGGCFTNEEDETTCKGGSTEESYRWHAHTRQSSGNVGVVLSYTGADVQGAWDTERLRFNDFHGAIGWKGVDQDLTVSVTYARQRDLYDESNFEADDGDPGDAEAGFFAAGACKTCFAPGSVFNNYNGEVWRGQIVHNYYVDDNTTVTSRFYAQDHRRDRYQIATLEDDPSDPEVDEPPVFGESPPFPNIGDDDAVYFGAATMFGRLRTFRHLGGEVRAEFANTPLIGGVNQDIQMGIRYEYQDMANRNFLGLPGQVLEDGDTAGLTIFDRSLQANTVSAFLQTDIKAAKNFHIVPGVRFEWYGVNRDTRVAAQEEGEAEGPEEPDDPNDADYQDDLDEYNEALEACSAFLGLDPNDIGEIEENCRIIEGIERSRYSEKYDSFNVLPGISFAYNGFYRTTLFAGYHRGLSTAVLRNEDFPAPDEIGNNFQIGVRSSAIMGLDFEVTTFHQRLSDFQYGDTFSSAGDRSFGRADEVHINGIELAGRLNSRPFTGGAYNFFGEANYTYNRAIIEKGSLFDDDGDFVANVDGNQVPEVPFHIAAFTFGVEQHTGWRWNASATYAYRGWFYTDAANTPYGGDGEGEDGVVPEVWLLSARFNLDIGNTGASVFIAGDNLTNEFYITDREDGLKPGMARTIWTGFKYKF